MRTQPSSQPALTGTPARKATFEPARSLGGDQSPAAGAPMALRLRVYVTRGKLDRAIVSECPCESTSALALRARQLTDPHTRRQLASQLRGTVDYVYRRGPRPIMTAVVIKPAAVRTGWHAILGLAQRLEGSAPVQPRGVVLTRRLLTDGLGPLCNPNSEQTLTEAVWDVLDALEDTTPSRPMPLPSSLAGPEIPKP